MDTTDHGAHHPPDPRIKHETTDVDLELVDRVGIGLAVAVALSMLVTWGLFRFLQGREAAADPPPRPVTAATAPGVPSPTLQTNEPADLERFRAEQERRLQSYGWVDRAAGVVQIPIDLAIELMSERGLPEAIGPAGEAGASSAVGAAQEGAAEMAVPEAAGAGSEGAEAAEEAVPAPVQPAPPGGR